MKDGKPIVTNWWVLLGVMAIAANLRPALTAVGPLLPSVREELGLTATVAGSVTALPLLTFAAVSWAAPALSRRLGVELALVAALMVLAAGIVLRSSGGATPLFAGTVVLAAGIGICNVLLPVLVRADLPDRVGVTTSWYTATQSGVSALAAGLAVPIALAVSGGWRTALGWWALVAVATALAWLPAAIRRRPAGGGMARGPARRVVKPRVWRSALAWQIAAMMALQSIGFYSVVTWLPTVFLSRGVSPVSSGLCLLVFQLVALGASLTMPLVLRLGSDQRPAAVLAACFYCIGFLGMATAPSASWLWVVLCGLGSGMSLPLVLTFISLRSPDSEHAASLSSMAQTIGYLGAAAGPVLIGAVNDLTGGWTLPLLLLAAAGAAQIVVGARAGRERFVG